mgnify:CR=1 FL=1
MAELVRFARSPYPLPLGAARRRGGRCSRSTIWWRRSMRCSAAPEPLRRPLIVADPEAADDSGHDRGAARRARPPARPHPGAAVAASKPRCGRPDGARSTSGSPARWWRTHRRCTRLGWSPPVSTPEGLAALARSEPRPHLWPFDLPNSEAPQTIMPGHVAGHDVSFGFRVGDQRVSTMKSVPLPVSPPMPWSEMISEAPGDISSGNPVERVLRDGDAVERVGRVRRSASSARRPQPSCPSPPS